MSDDSHSWPWPITGRLLGSGPLPERFPGQYAPEMKAAWQPWIDAARAGASVARLKELEPVEGFTITSVEFGPHQAGAAVTISNLTLDNDSDGC